MAGTAAAVAVNHRNRGVVRIEADVVTDASGDMSATVIGDAFGRLVGVLTDGGLDASASVTLKDFKTGATVFGPYVTGTEATPVFVRPTGAIVTKAGAAIAAADTAPNTQRDIFVAGKVTLTIASGGNAETAKIAFIFCEDDRLGDIALTV